MSETIEGPGSTSKTIGSFSIDDKRSPVEVSCSKMIEWILALIVVLTLTTLFIIYRFSLFTKITMIRTVFESKKCIYRVVKGDSKLLSNEQRLFTHRAQSLWGKEMEDWSTFRITFNPAANYGVFGIIVPESFDIDPECLQELGFTLGYLEEITDSLQASIPRRCFTTCSWAQRRVKNSINKFFKCNKDLTNNKILAEIRDRKHRMITYVVPLKEHKGLWTQGP